MSLCLSDSFCLGICVVLPSDSFLTGICVRSWTGVSFDKSLKPVPTRAFPNVHESYAPTTAGAPRTAAALHTRFSMVAHFNDPAYDTWDRARPHQNHPSPSQDQNNRFNMSINMIERDDENVSANLQLISKPRLPKWDGTPIRASLFLRDIGEYAAQRSFLTLLLNDYFVSKSANTIIAANADVVLAVKQHFSDPVAHPLADDIQHPNLHPRVPSSDCTYTLTAEDKRLYNASPALFLCECSVHCQTLICAISNPDVARRVRNNSHGDARHVLAEIARIRGELTTAQIAHHLSRIATFVKQGITRASGWPAWKTLYDDLTFCLPLAHALPATYIS